MRFEQVKRFKIFWVYGHFKRQECKQNTIGPIRDDLGKIVFIDSVKATLMNDYFSTTGENLMSNIQTTQNHSKMQPV